MAVDECETHVWAKKKGYRGVQSSISRSSSGENFGKDLFCYCGGVAVVRTAKTKANLGRAFYTCPLPKGDPAKCGFFTWVDEVRQRFVGGGITGDDILLKKVGSLAVEVRRLTYCVSALSMIMFVFMMLWIVITMLK